MLSKFETKAYGKWILAGEHAVLRGHPAIVFPLTSHALTLAFEQSSSPLILDYMGEQANTAQSKIKTFIDTAFEAAHIPPEARTGQLVIENNIPVGTGLGSSAALSVAITRFIKACFAPNLDIFRFSHQLEHLFHGQSSGLDVAGSMADTPIYFSNGHITPMSPCWQPNIQLSYSGTPGNTADCIQMVQSFLKNQPEKAVAIDNAMADAVKEARAALCQTQNIQALTQALKQASDCFSAWGLITPELAAHMDDLYQKGALAVKPTGSGGGGHVISLWST